MSLVGKSKKPLCNNITRSRPHFGHLLYLVVSELIILLLFQVGKFSFSTRFTSKWKSDYVLNFHCIRTRTYILYSSIYTSCVHSAGHTLGTHEPHWLVQSHFFLFFYTFTFFLFARRVFTVCKDVKNDFPWTLYSPLWAMFSSNWSEDATATFKDCTTQKKRN